MRIVIILLLASNLCVAQHEESDLSRSGHIIKYLGDEYELSHIIEPLRSTHPNAVFERDEICEQAIKKVGTTEKNNYLIIFLDTSFGISCRHVYKTLILHNSVLVGYYTSDLFYGAEIHGSILIWAGEGGLTKIKTDLSNEPPTTLQLGDGPPLTLEK